MIFLGFFSCGYQLVFITAHFPAFVAETCGAIDPAGILAGLGVGSTATLGAVAISLIGLANIAGTTPAGILGKRFSKKYLLSAIYLGRTPVSATFILVPVTPTTVVLFSLAMEALWLATVPLTSGLVAPIHGIRYRGTLYGIVFFSHQLGSFMGCGWAASCMTSMAPVRRSGGSGSASRRSARWCICRSARRGWR